MSAANNQPSPASEFVTFIQHALPGLDDGTYKLDISAHIDDASGAPVNLDPLSRTYTFAVTGDRFRLVDPAKTVASVFPASNAAGEFDTVLAHVVFNAPTLPWSRYPTLKPPEEPEAQAGEGTEVDVPTWLAVLVLSDEDVAVFPNGELKLDPVTTILGNLFPPAAYPDSNLGDNYSYFTGATNTSGLEIDEQPGDPVQTIDIPLKLFAQIAPTLDDLVLSAHVRQVSVENKPLALGAAQPTDPLGTYSIVVGNRLPAPNSTSHAYLVSLERLENFLPATSEGGTLTDPNLDIDRSLRLAVLQHWTFTTTGGTATFVEQLEHLNGRTPGGPDATNTNLRLDVPDAGPPIKSALSAGYVPLNHELRTSETTVSWYRGPLSPIDAGVEDLELPISSPDQALVFDPTTGMFDASLAAAWTIGRLIALQDKSYAASLYSWKKGRAQAVVDAAEREVIAEVLGEMLALLPPLPPSPTDGKPLLHEAMRVVLKAARDE
jgi:hypothetical protein